MKTINRDMDLIKSLHLLNRVHNSDDFDQAIKILSDYISNHPRDFRGSVRIHEYPSGSEYNYWKVPQKWIPRKCRLLTTSGKLIISLDQHPLVLTPFSDSFTGTISREELFKHLHFREDLPDAIPYIFRKQYRHWEKGWGIALPCSLANTLTDPEYRVEIDAEFAAGTMKVLEYTVSGASDGTVLMCGHLDHPGQSNDGVAGVVHAIETMKGVEARFRDLHYTYKVVICPEIVGSAIYLNQNPEVVNNAILCLCTNMLGHDASFAVCRSKIGTSRLDRALLYVLKQRGLKFLSGLFRKYPDCGDEISFDAPGIHIPTTTLSRVGELFRYYHTSLDTPDLIDTGRFRESVAVAVDAFSLIEWDYLPKRTFVGNPCLANPEFNLYLEPRNVSNLYNKASEISNLINIDEISKSVDPRLFMDFFLSNLEGHVSLLEIAQGFSVPFEFVKAYADEFLKGGLITKQSLSHPRIVNDSLNGNANIIRVASDAAGFLFTNQNPGVEAK